MTGVLNDIIDGYHPEALSITELLNEIYERRKRVTRLEELKVPEIIMENEREKYLSTIRVLMKYMNMNEIERLLEEKEKTKLQRMPRVNHA
jgi:hypothetical protein